MELTADPQPSGIGRIRGGGCNFCLVFRVSKLGDGKLHVGREMVGLDGAIDVGPFQENLSKMCCVDSKQSMRDNISIETTGLLGHILREKGLQRKLMRSDKWKKGDGGFDATGNAARPLHGRSEIAVVIRWDGRGSQRGYAF